MMNYESLIAPLETKRAALEQELDKLISIMNRPTMLQKAFHSQDRIAQYCQISGMSCPDGKEVEQVRVQAGDIDYQIEQIDEMIASLKDAERWTIPQ